MKIGLIGCGYWGRIILKNLRELGYKDIVVCEQQDIDWEEVGAKYTVVSSYEDVECDAAIIVTPATSHFGICKHFLSKGIPVFCEKPLTLAVAKSKYLYKLAEKNNTRLFVDWIFTFNPCVHVIKELIKKKGKPKSIIANRMNFGPAREDVNAKWDLASHDVSILCYLLEEYPHSVNWFDFRRDEASEQEDSTVGILSFEDTAAQINASWEYGIKNRLYVFEFDDGFVYWDDNTKSIIYGSESIEVDKTSPLTNSLNAFLLNDYDMTAQKELTLNTTDILNDGSIVQ